jgi:UDP-N-acetylmuramoylalanine--D-glutamate ligase
MRNALVIGFGLSGRSAAQFLLDHNWQVAAVDKNAHLLCREPEVKSLIAKGIPLLGETEHFAVDAFQLAVISPGIPPENPLAEKLRQAGIECIGEVELAFRYMKNKAIGITGTNGKTTVTLLLEHILQKAGKEVKALGNVGVPLAQSLPQLSNEAVVVAELSSFQLETLHKRNLEAAVILNITPDHLDRYANMQAYAEAKALIGKIVKEGGLFLVYEAPLKEFPQIFMGMSPLSYGYGETADYRTDLESIYFRGKKQCDLPHSLKGHKSHDLENFLAAFVLATHCKVTPNDIINSYDTFTKPHHRIEFIAEKNGVAFYDDSKGTNIDSVLRAVDSMARPTILIAGGVHKGFSYASWIEPFKGKVKKIFAIGQSAPIIERELSVWIPVQVCSSLQEAVDQGYQMANPGDAILLSPGCSSFDMFKDYVHRGEEFVRCVNGLEEGVLKS